MTSISMDTTNISKTVIITGSASGMGYACTEKFLQEGWRVIGLDMQEQSLNQSNFIGVNVNITNEVAIKEALCSAIGDDHISALVNAAGIFPTSNLEDFTPELYRQIFDINVLGTLNMARVSASRMQQGGSILFFASVDAFAVSQNQLLYSASKAAVVSITKSLAIELSGRNIIVNAIAPGWVETQGTLAGGRLEEGVKSVPLKRAASPDEIASWVWNLSMFPGYVTGETLCISGGVIVR